MFDIDDRPTRHEAELETRDGASLSLYIIGALDRQGFWDSPAERDEAIELTELERERELVEQTIEAESTAELVGRMSAFVPLALREEWLEALGDAVHPEEVA